MPGQQSGGRRRTRGSWTPRIIGISAVVLLAAGAAVAALVAGAPVGGHGPARSARVVSVQTAGLVNPGPPGATDAPEMLLSSPAGLAFGPVPRRQLTSGNPQWTADAMAGGSYIFIYAPDGRCLAAARSNLVLRRCDLRRSQRWRGVHGGVRTEGHYFRQFSNLAVGGCIAAGGALPAAGPGDRAAALAPCAPGGSAGPGGAARTWRQLLGLWWSS